MTENDIKKAVEFCCNDTTTCTGCPLNDAEYECGVYLSKYIKENEPAPDATEDKLNTKIVHTDDSTSYAFCQAIKDGIEMIKHDSVIAFSSEMPINDYIARLAEIHGICEILEKGTIYAQGDK